MINPVPVFRILSFTFQFALIALSAPELVRANKTGCGASAT
jgi:hypothetical protein